ncbi:hypothetical protein Q4525_07360 [Shimia thalassica]|uniref:hypothetical protein n=1 Tax=Shimia thalassica TaxID=1715693 RepID=UPI001C08B500|nr:hypothetical protein [Shimia thalassica]MBU2942938.1 hypothetical protein [Shimia thalassica]MDO6502739.1 hypothetical protein [Shimia thalassica]
MTMEIRFSGEDKDGSPIVYVNWRELAQACPYALIDLDSLEDAKRIWLVQELEPHVKLTTQKSGDERAVLPPDPYDLSEDPIARFATNNLRRLRQTPDLLDVVQQEAEVFLSEKLGEFSGLRQTYVQRRGKGWRSIKLDADGAIECERLVDLFEINLAPRLSPIWHAVRILVCIELARSMVRARDAVKAAEAGISVGESRRALGNIVAKAAKSAEGGREKDADVVTRNERWRTEAADIRKRRPELKDSAIANHIIREQKLNFSNRTVRNAIKVGNKGS